MTNSKNYSRHGGPYDRGDADKYYGRPYNPHYYLGDTYSTPMVSEKNMTEDQINAYKAGYANCQTSKY